MGERLLIAREDGESFEEIDPWSEGNSYKDLIEEEDRAWAAAERLWEREMSAQSFPQRRSVAALALARIDRALPTEFGYPPILWHSWQCDVGDMLESAL